MDFPGYGLSDAAPGYGFTPAEHCVVLEQVLRSFAVSLRGLAHTHPQAYGLLCRACLTEPALRAMDVSLTALERAGLDRPWAAEMLRTLFSYAVGTACWSSPP